MKTDIRKQIEAAIIAVIAEAEEQGLHGVTAAARAFPGTPSTVLWECWAEWDSNQVEGWWQTVERTIDGEVIRNAITTAGAR